MFDLLATLFGCIHQIVIIIIIVIVITSWRCVLLMVIYIRARRISRTSKSVGSAGSVKFKPNQFEASVKTTGCERCIKTSDKVGTAEDDGNEERLSKAIEKKQCNENKEPVSVNQNNKQDEDSVPSAERAILTEIEDLAEKYGLLDNKCRVKMLQLCATKAKRQGNARFGEDLKEALEEFVGEEIGDGFASYKILCRQVVKRVPDDKWMRFVRLHLNLEEKEIKKFKRRFATFSNEQERQLAKAIRANGVNPAVTGGKLLIDVNAAECAIWRTN